MQTYMLRILTNLTNKQAREEYILDESSWELQEHWSTDQITCEHLTGFHFLRYRFKQYIPGVGFIKSAPIYWRFDLGARLLHQVTDKEIEDYLKQRVYEMKMQMRANA
ncbi:MAG: hypothetical protein EOM21_19715 [Gammaproteobacteria bacterium]|nr:hypothetical protein [Gammaproteobacteria bacterium]